MSATTSASSSSIASDATMTSTAPTQYLQKTSISSPVPAPLPKPTSCPSCGSVPDSLATFLVAYGPAGAILVEGQEFPAQENGPFGSVRRRHPKLVHTLRTASSEGRKRATTVHDGRVLRWTITREPTPDGDAQRVIVLAQDSGDDQASPSDLGDADDGQSSNGTARRRGPSSSGTPDSASMRTFPSPPPSDYLTTISPSIAHGDVAPLIPRAPAPNQSWMSNPRYAALVTAGGEIGEIVRSMDWNHTPFGPVESWGVTFVMMLGVMLHAPFGMSLFWGNSSLLLYNQYYADILGPAKHPQSFAQPAAKVWAEIWAGIGPFIQTTLQGKTHYYEDDQLLIHRGNRETIEEAYFTWAYIPLYDGDTIIGVYNPVYETTGKVLSERRMRALQQLSTRFVSARTMTGLVVDTCEVLAQLDDDVPYGAVYMVQKDEFLGTDGADRTARPRTGPTTLILQETIGIPFDAPAAPNKLVVDPNGLSPMPFGAPTGWTIDLRRTVGQSELSFHVCVAPLLEQLPMRGSVKQITDRAASLPIVQGNELVGVLVLYLGSGVPVDDQMTNFLDLLARQCSTSASMVASYENELQKLEEMAALDRAKTAFFTNISHELRTPLTLILGPISELMSANISLPTSAQASLGIAERNARRLLKLVNTVLDFSIAEAGRMTARFVPTALGPFTADLASAFRSAAELAGLQYTVDCATRVPTGLLVWVDRDKYEKVVYNLLSNAIKYTVEGWVRIGAHVDGDRFVLEVSDSGIGIPRAELRSVFDKFHRTSSVHGQGRTIEGTGIGLSYTQELVKMHKGEITVDSEPGVGSTFRVFFSLGKDHLPAACVVEDEGHSDWTQTPPIETPHFLMDETVQMVPPSEAETNESSHNSGMDVLWQPLIFGERSRARIILADDNADMRRYVAGLLTKYCDVTQFADGARALAELQAHPQDYDLILSDDMMPNMTGPELLEAVRADPTLRVIPFIFISAKAGDEARMEGLARGADDYVAKPFKARELLLRLHTQLQSASVRNELETRMQEHIQKLEESRESFKALCDRLQVGVHRSLPNGTVTWANQKWMTTFGLLEDRLNGWGDIIHPEDRPVAQQAYSSAMQTNKGYSEPLEMRVTDVTKEGESHYLDIIYDLQPEFSSDASGEVLSWVGVWSDVSAMRRLQRLSVEAERAHAQEAERNRELQEQFIDITCHELRNPLNAIYNSAALLGESLSRIEASLGSLRGNEAWTSRPEFEQINAELQEDIDSANTIVLCAKHQKRITDDVLNVSKLSAGLITLVTADFSPFEEVKNTVRMFRDEVSARGLVLEFERDASLDRLDVGHVRGDSGRFVQVVVNLLSNSIKFTETAARHIVRVRIGAMPAPPEDMDDPMWPKMDQEDLLPMCAAAPVDARVERLRIYVAVADSGHGMTQEEQNKLFQRFSQASTRTYGEFGGHGLGLYVSRMLVELHGGSIHLQSKKNVGTVLRFYIHVERSTTTPAPTPTPLIEFGPISSGRVSLSNGGSANGDMSARRLRVLVVEDNLINQRLLIKLLTILHCDTHACKDGQECVDLLISLAQPEEKGEPNFGGFDLVLMDLEMPVLDGLGATRRIRELEAEAVLPYSVPIVAVSGNARSEWTDRAQNAGMDGFLRKPYNRAELEELLSRWRPKDSETTPAST